MDDSTHVVWGMFGRKTVILAVTIESDGFTVASSPDEAGFVAAKEIVGIDRGERHPRGGHVLRIDHTAPGVPSPVAVILKFRHPARRAIEGLRPDLLKAPPRSPWWRRWR
jgi:hypothetical protein